MGCTYLLDLVFWFSLPCGWLWQLVGKAGLKVRAGSLVSRAHTLQVPEQLLACWWVGWVYRLPGCRFLGLVSTHLWVKVVLRIRKACCWAGPGILGLVPGPLCLGMSPWVFGFSALGVPVLVPAHWCVGMTPGPFSGQDIDQGHLWDRGY